MVYVSSDLYAYILLKIYKRIIIFLFLFSVDLKLVRLCVSLCVWWLLCVRVCVNDLKLVCRIPLDLIAGELLVRSDSKIV